MVVAKLRHFSASSCLQGTLDNARRSELAALVAQGQRLSLRKAQAAALLTERGYPVTLEAIAAADE